MAMHLAETREQARSEARHGILESLVGYIQTLTGSALPYGTDPDAAIEQWTTEGLPGFGVATIGTPDDAVATISAIDERCGGFGTVLLLSHDCADHDATRRSLRLFAEEVVPRLRSSNAARERSAGWASERSGELLGGMASAIRAAVTRYSEPDVGQPSVGSWLPTDE